MPFTLSTLARYKLVLIRIYQINITIFDYLKYITVPTSLKKNVHFLN